MLGSGEVATAVADFLEESQLPNIVLDPVIRSSSGASLAGRARAGDPGQAGYYRFAMSLPPILTRRQYWPEPSRLPPTPLGKRCFRACGRWRRSFGNLAAGQWLLPAATSQPANDYLLYGGAGSVTGSRSFPERTSSPAQLTGRGAPLPPLWPVTWRRENRCRRRFGPRKSTYGRRSRPRTRWDEESGQSITGCESSLMARATWGLVCVDAPLATEVERYQTSVGTRYLLKHGHTPDERSLRCVSASTFSAEFPPAWLPPPLASIRLSRTPWLAILPGCQLCREGRYPAATIMQTTPGQRTPDRARTDRSAHE